MYQNSESQSSKSKSEDVLFHSHYLREKAVDNCWASKLSSAQKSDSERTMMFIGTAVIVITALHSSTKKERNSLKK
jgi:hypothetical protein